jgi:hypothetical protein
VRSCLKRFCLSLMAGAVFCGAVALAGPMEITPVLVKGKLAPYSRVKKHNRIWYPASVVGHHRGINFSYDYATKTLFADGIETLIKSVVVDRVVYLDISPQVTADGLRPGIDSLQARRAQLRAYDGASSHLEGRSDRIFMSQNVPEHVHPWAGGSVDRSPIIDLDPTSEAPVAPHMRPGARPPEAPPEELPNRLPQPGQQSVATENGGTVQVVAPENGAQSDPTVQVVAPEGMPRQVTEQGGPSTNSTASSNTTGLQPIPKVAAPAPDTSPFNSSGKLQSTSSQNSVFKVDVMAGSWQISSDNLLRLKLSQVNISKVAQSNLGTFAVRCADGTRVEASRTRSYLPDGTLAPGSLREGELVFRLTSNQRPQALELEGALGLSVPLHQM